MTPPRLSACLIALTAACLTAPLAFAQEAPARTYSQQIAGAPPSLPHALGPIPDVAPEAVYPGMILYEADATDLDRRIISVRQSIPVVAAGPMVLLYPKYLPGNHAATGPIQLIAGLTLTGDGQRIEWLRDPLDPYAFHIDVPEGVARIDVAFQWLTQHDPSQWRVVMTPEMVNLQWEKALLYPAGYAHRNITVRPSVRLPAGWSHGAALDVEERSDEVVRFAPVSVEAFADSPLFAGRNIRRIDIDPTGAGRLHVNLVADAASDLTPSDEQLGHFRALVAQADRLFGSRPFDRYEFLVALTNRLGGVGLEHHRSSENTVTPGFFTQWGRNYGDQELLPHEFTHAWNGKYRRPADQLTDNLNQPLQNSLLWVYEGQTQYWGAVLAARSGLVSRDEALANLASIAATYEHQAGREWRALQDTVNQNLMGYRASTPWPTWSRTGGDYYREALLIWLDADTLIREQTDGRRSLDDFAKSFFSGPDGDWTPRPYVFEDVVEALNAVHPHDWASFLRDRLDAVGPEARAPLDGLERGGWRLTWAEEPNAAEKRVASNWANDFQYSLGFSLNGARITAVRWGGPAWEAGLSGGWELVAVNDQAGSAPVLRQAISAARDGAAPLRLIVRQGERFKTLDMPWTGGLRHPRLERIEGAPDRLSDILSPRRR